MKELTNNDFFFCYTKILSLYLRRKGIPYILKANSVKDGAEFTLYHKTERLQEALREYNAQ